MQHEGRKHDMVLVLQDAVVICADSLSLGKPAIGPLCIEHSTQIHRDRVAVTGNVREIENDVA